jgi:acyl-[acyl-carrier-protein]-phospholipid O-acyltransferase/long-chain-fatty-acid--[acyl-carrier-protein] ligase
MVALFLSLGLVILLAVLFYGKPILLVRIPVWILCHTIYRVRVFGRQNIPVTGPALLVCNHVSYFDWLFLLFAQKRFIHFVIFAGWTRRFGLRHILRWAGVIPIDRSAGPRAIVNSLRQAGEALKRGQMVCIFAEGRFTRTGFLLPFHRGFEQILRHAPSPVIPVCLEHVWGSIFSYRGGKLIWKWPVELPYPVTVAFGSRMPATASAIEVRQAVQKLSADCAIERSSRQPLVHRQFVRLATRHPFRPCFFDATLGTDKPLRYGTVLAGAICLARKLEPILASDQMVGIWLPAGAGAALVNIALALLGKTSVNLNYTVSEGTVRAGTEQCKLRHIISSRRFLAHVALHPGPEIEMIYLEELHAAISTGQKLRAYLAILLLPRLALERWILRLGKHRPDDLCTVIFSSGTTGDPKGIMLLHRNVAANADSMIQTIDARSRDRILGVLPFFHSFGFTVTLWVPLQVGASVVFHADPRQGREIGRLCKKHRCTIFVTTPTFLRLCLRRCEPNDFASLRLLMCGAEKLPVSLAEEFKQKFGILPMDGYGCTELSPAAIVNMPDQDMDGFRQVGNKPGTIGQPMPGIAAKIVNSDTFEPVPTGQEGMLLIYGPNVMAGYLNKPELTREVIRDGWYVTGDMARCDEDGFITLTDRLSRFSKIGGEMVPHQKIEDELHKALGTAERVCVVTGVPDESKGERLVVLHLPLDGHTPGELRKKLEATDLPNLWLPREKDFIQIAEMPILGSGKLDLRKCRELATKMVAS